MNTPSNSTESNPLKIRRGRVASVDLYEIKDSELDLLEKGSPATIQLNFAVFLLSIAFTCIAALCTATFKWSIAQSAFLLVTIVGILMGLYLLICWKKTRTSVFLVVRTIRNRIDIPELTASVVAQVPTSDAEPPTGDEPVG